MKPHQSNPSLRGRKMAHQARNMQRGGGDEAYYPFFSLSWFIDKLLSGLNRLFVAFKHKLYSMMSGRVEGFSLPWFKIGLAAFAVFLFAKKDLQFSVNMRAPLRGASLEEPAATGVALRSNTMSLGQNLWFKGKDSGVSTKLEDLDAEAVKSYIKRFSRVAIAEMQKYGIPASVKMGQAILESKAGSASGVASENNHFGAPLSGKNYASAWENWRSHSLLLKTSVPEAFEYGKSYKKWSKALKVYNNDRSYADQLLQVIEAYQLYLLDEEI
ncbi:MAG: glucosaminidase domain-containing protein [Saprospiraceae bacterium]